MRHIAGHRRPPRTATTPWLRPLRDPQLPSVVRTLIDARAGGACELCGVDIPIGAVPGHLHRRRPYGLADWLRADTDASSPANLLLLCVGCRATVHSNPEQAVVFGWTLPPAGGPATIPVLMPLMCRWVLLDALGEWRLCTAQEVPPR